MKKIFFLCSCAAILIYTNCSRDRNSSSTLESHINNINVIDNPVEPDTPIDTSVLRPIAADPAEVINFPKENWRNAYYELFSWDIFADSSPVLIFDYANYAVQDRMLKRLAFFVEKAGFRGRLASDSEIAHLHGWNAHDYRAEDLARFFDLARRQQFSLLKEETDLEKILLNERIIRMQGGNIVPGTGAVISIARESTESLRWRFMAHEGFHALYFIDKDFRDFCRHRWEIFPEPAKSFLTAYFNLQQYDTNDEYLLVNEFMGHIMQQSVAQAAEYFSLNLPLRLKNTRYSDALPEYDPSTGTWSELAEIFTIEAQALSEYVNMRWGFTAGRVWRSR